MRDRLDLFARPTSEQRRRQLIREDRWKKWELGWKESATTNFVASGPAAREWCTSVSFSYWTTAAAATHGLWRLLLLMATGKLHKNKTTTRTTLYECATCCTACCRIFLYSADWRFANYHTQEEDGQLQGPTRQRHSIAQLERMRFDGGGGGGGGGAEGGLQSRYLHFTWIFGDLTKKTKKKIVQLVAILCACLSKTFTCSSQPQGSGDGNPWTRFIIYPNALIVTLSFCFVENGTCLNLRTVQTRNKFKIIWVP